MDNDQVKKAGTSLVAALAVVAALFGLRADAEDDVGNALEVLAENPLATFLLVGALCLAAFTWRYEIGSYFGWRSANSTKKRLQAWCLRNGYGIKDEVAPGGQEFLFTIHDAANRPLSATKIKTELCIRLGVVMEIEKPITDVITAAGDDAHEMIVRLRLEVARNGARYRGIGVPLSDVTITTRLPLEVREYQFIEGIQTMTNAVVAFRQVLAVEFRRLGRLTGRATPAGVAEETGEEPETIVASS
ncbi:MAG: hypothetical protein WEB00_02400 [Dehalococcoidia bacterium]